MFQLLNQEKIINTFVNINKFNKNKIILNNKFYISTNKFFRSKDFKLILKYKKDLKEFFIKVKNNQIFLY